MVSSLTPTQRSLVSEKVSKEIRFKRKSLMKQRAGKKLTDKEARAVRRTRRQNIAIGFSKARKVDPSIPELDTKTGQVE